MQCKHIDGNLFYSQFEKPNYEEEEEAYMEAGRNDAGPSAGGAAATDAAEKAILVSKVDPTLWKLELERVTPKLRILLNADAKDWRSHLEEVQQHSKVRDFVLWSSRHAAACVMKGSSLLAMHVQPPGACIKSASSHA